MTKNEMNMELISARLERGELRQQRDELLEACKALLPQEWDTGEMDHMPGVKLARMAIAKAEGKA